MFFLNPHHSLAYHELVSVLTRNVSSWASSPERSIAFSISIPQFPPFVLSHVPRPLLPPCMCRIIINPDWLNCPFSAIASYATFASCSIVVLDQIAERQSLELMSWMPLKLAGYMSDGGCVIASAATPNALQEKFKFSVQQKP